MTRMKPAEAKCASAIHPEFGVKRIALNQLLSSKGCGIDHCEPHRLNFNVALLITQGSSEHMIDFAPVEIQERDLVLIRAGQVHAFFRNRSIEGEILTFTPEFVAATISLASVTDAIEWVFQSGPRIRLGSDSSNLTGRWYSEFGDELALRGGPRSDARIACSFGLLVNRLAALKELTPGAIDKLNRAPKLVREFTALLENNFVQHRDAAWYANRLHVSGRTLDRLLVRDVKRTCKELITRRIVLEAKRLLTDPNLQVKHVAHSLRFGEVANFSRFFHHNAGLTPRDFRCHPLDWHL